MCEGTLPETMVEDFLIWKTQGPPLVLRPLIFCTASLSVACYWHRQRWKAHLMQELLRHSLDGRYQGVLEAWQLLPADSGTHQDAEASFQAGERY